MDHGAVFVTGVLAFFFQAEDGIRDLVRSRGLGDVYKRQPSLRAYAAQLEASVADAYPTEMFFTRLLAQDTGAVSYTHLTLPTSDLV